MLKGTAIIGTTLKLLHHVTTTHKFGWIEGAKIACRFGTGCFHDRNAVPPAYTLYNSPFSFVDGIQDDPLVVVGSLQPYIVPSH